MDARISRFSHLWLLQLQTDHNRIAANADQPMRVSSWFTEPNAQELRFAHSRITQSDNKRHTAVQLSERI